MPGVLETSGVIELLKGLVRDAFGGNPPLPESGPPSVSWLTGEVIPQRVEIQQAVRPTVKNMYKFVQDFKNVRQFLRSRTRYDQTPDQDFIFLTPKGKESTTYINPSLTDNIAYLITRYPNLASRIVNRKPIKHKESGYADSVDLEDYSKGLVIKETPPTKLNEGTRGEYYRPTKESPYHWINAKPGEGINTSSLSSLGHELTHYVQKLQGRLPAPNKISSPNINFDAYFNSPVEVEARQVGATIEKSADTFIDLYNHLKAKYPLVFPKRLNEK